MVKQKTISVKTVAPVHSINMMMSRGAFAFIFDAVVVVIVIIIALPIYSIYPGLHTVHIVSIHMTQEKNYYFFSLICLIKITAGHFRGITETKSIEIII